MGVRQESILLRQIDPALLEWVGENEFRARVFPIPAKGSKRVQLTYTQVLKSENGAIKYVYPLMAEKFAQHPIRNLSVKIDVRSTPKIKAVSAAIGSVGVFETDNSTLPDLAEKGIFRREHSIKLNFVERDVTPKGDVILSYEVEKEESEIYLLPYRPKDDDGYFLLFISPQIKLRPHIQRRDWILLVDISGSVGPQEYNAAKAAARVILSQLSDKNRFNIVAFDITARSFKDGFVPATAENVQIAMEYLESLTTNGASDFETAFEQLSKLTKDDKQAQIVYIGDGLPTIGATGLNLQKLLGKKVVFHAVCVGDIRGQDLLEGLAKSKNGLVRYLSPSEVCYH